MSDLDFPCFPSKKRTRQEVAYPRPVPGPPPQGSRPLSSSALQRTSLLWLKHTTPLYRPLSLNICREISSYLEHIPPFLHLKNRKIIAINPFQQEWTGLYEVGLEITGLHSYLSISENCIFVGVIEYRKLPANSSPKACFHLYQDGVPWKLCERQIKSWNSGLIYDTRRESVYFFGGTDDYGRGVSTACQFNISTQQWTDLEMGYIRVNFNPCRYQQLIYLCSANQEHVETFDPATAVFRLFAGFALKSVSLLTLTLTAVVGDELILMYNQRVVGYQLKTGVVRSDDQVVPSISLKGPPVVYNGCFYCVDCSRNQMWMLQPFGISESHALDYFT